MESEPDYSLSSPLLLSTDGNNDCSNNNANIGRKSIGSNQDNNLKKRSKNSISGNIDDVDQNLSPLHYKDEDYLESPLPGTTQSQKCYSDEKEDYRNCSSKCDASLKKGCSDLRSSAALFDLITIALHVTFFFHLHNSATWSSYLPQQIILLTSLLLPLILCNIIFLRTILSTSRITALMYGILMGFQLYIWFLIFGLCENISGFYSFFRRKERSNSKQNDKSINDSRSSSIDDDNAFPLKEYELLRAIVMAIWEDILQLVVQFWLFSLRSYWNKYIGAGTIVLMVFVTFVTLTHVAWIFWRIKSASKKNRKRRDKTMKQLTKHEEGGKESSFGYFFSHIITRTLGMTGPNDEEAIEMAHHIKNGTNDEYSIRLIGGTITDTGCIALADAIRSRSSFVQQQKCQRSGNNHIGTTNSFSGVDGANLSVQRLFLSRNKISNDGFIALSLALEAPGCGIKELWLDNNNSITSVGWIRLGMSLNINESIDILRLSECPDVNNNDQDEDTIRDIMIRSGERVRIL